MSVAVTTSGPAQSTWWQRLTGTEPKTIVTETSRTEITNDPGGSFSWKTALRNGGIGAGVAGVLGGVALLGKVALPVIGKVVSVAGLAKLAGVGAAIGIATAAIPLIAPKVKESPAAKAALVGAGIGAAAGALLPLLPIPIGAAIGAGVGLLIHHRKNHPVTNPTEYPGYRAYPGYVPAGTSQGDSPVPAGLVPVTPNYGSYAGTAMNPYATGSYGYPASGYTQGYGQGYGTQGYGSVPYGVAVNPYATGVAASPYGYGSLAATPGQVQQPAAAAPAAAPKPAAVRRPKATKAAARPKAKTFTDKLGNVRQVGTGTIVRAAKATPGIGRVQAGTAAPVGATAPAGYGVPTTAGATGGLAELTNVGSYVPGMSSALPFSGGSPFAATSPYAATMGAVPQTAAATMQPTAIPARPVA